MAEGKETIFAKFLAPVIGLFIDEKQLSQFYESTDWQVESDRFRNPSLYYPAYYKSQNFHGIKDGYLNPGASVSYDSITQYVLLPNETIVRQSLINAIAGQPRRILDLGCGTGSTTLMLKQAFPQAEVIGLDLSPYMLVVADYKAKKAGLDIKFVHGHAEHTSYADNSFDIVTASLLFHETPAHVAKNILQESYRLLQTGGEVLILDGNQKTLRQVTWLHDLFEEPYVKVYADGNLDAWMGAAGFESVQTEDLWWLQQVTHGVKPISVKSSARQYQAITDTITDRDLEDDSTPAFGI